MEDFSVMGITEIWLNVDGFDHRSFFKIYDCNLFNKDRVSESA